MLLVSFPVIPESIFSETSCPCSISLMTCLCVSFPLYYFMLPCAPFMMCCIISCDLCLISFLLVVTPALIDTPDPHCLRHPASFSLPLSSVLWIKLFCYSAFLNTCHLSSLLDMIRVTVTITQPLRDN